MDKGNEWGDCAAVIFKVLMAAMMAGITVLVSVHASTKVKTSRLLLELDEISNTKTYLLEYKRLYDKTCDDAGRPVSSMGEGAPSNGICNLDEWRTNLGRAVLLLDEEKILGIQNDRIRSYVNTGRIRLAEMNVASSKILKGKTSALDLTPSEYIRLVSVMNPTASTLASSLAFTHRNIDDIEELFYNHRDEFISIYEAKKTYPILADNLENSRWLFNLAAKWDYDGNKKSDMSFSEIQIYLEQEIVRLDKDLATYVGSDNVSIFGLPTIAIQYAIVILTGAVSCVFLFCSGLSINLINRAGLFNGNSSFYSSATFFALPYPGRQVLTPIFRAALFAFVTILPAICAILFYPPYQLQFESLRLSELDSILITENVNRALTIANGPFSDISAITRYGFYMLVSLILSYITYLFSLILFYRSVRK